MADYSITISNQAALIGGGVRALWNSIEWGTDRWGDLELIQTFNKVLIVSPIFTSTVGRFDFQKSITESTTVSDSVSKDAAASIYETMSASTEFSGTVLENGNWDYVFPRPTIEAEDQVNTTWTEL